MSKSNQGFLSYCTHDSEFAQRLCLELLDAGIVIWMDQRDSDSYPETIADERLRQTTSVMVLLSDEYIDTDYCMDELSIAIQSGLPIIPVLLSPIDIPTLLPQLKDQPVYPFVNPQERKLLPETVADFLTFLSDHYDIVPPLPISPEMEYADQLLPTLKDQSGTLLSLLQQNNLENHPGNTQPIMAWDSPGIFSVYNPLPLSDQDSPQSIPLMNVRDVVNWHPYVILHGEAGSGKTTILRQLAYEQTEAYLNNPERERLAIYVSLAQWDGEQKIEQHIQQQCSLPDPSMLMGADVYVDDLYFRDDTDISKASMLESWFSSAHAPARAIVATRSPYHQMGIDWNHPVIEIHPMDEAHIREFVTTYAEAGIQADTLDRFIDAVEFVTNPFLVSALILVSSSQDTDVALPQNTGSLLSNLIFDLLEAHGIRAGVNSNWTTLEEMLARLAVHMLDEDLYFGVRVNDAQQMVASSYLQEALEAKLLCQEDDRVRFLHEYVLWYFAAIGLSEEGLHTRLSLPKLGKRGALIDQKWNLPIRLLVEMSMQPDRDLQTISEVNPILALECTRTRITVTNNTLKQILRRVLTQVAQENAALYSVLRDVLATLPQEKVIPLLIQQVRRGNWLVRATASSLLSELPITLKRGLVKILREADVDFRDHIPVALRQLGDAAIPTLIQSLQDETWVVRRGAVWALGEIGDQAGSPALVQAFDDSNEPVVKEVMIALGKIGDVATIDTLLKGLTHQDWRVREAASEALGQLGSPALVGLVQMLDHDDSDVRRWAVQALSKINRVTALDALIKASYDSDVEVRAAAIEALGNLEDMVAINRLIEALSDKTPLRDSDQQVGDVAARILNELGYSHTPSSNVPLVENGEDEMIREQTQGIKDTSSPAMTGKKRLQEMTSKSSDVATSFFPTDDINHLDWTIRRAAVYAITNKTEDVVTLPIIKKALKDEEMLVRQAAVRKLATLRTSFALRGLLYALTDKDHQVSDAAAAGLQQLGKQATPGLLKLIAHQSVNVRGVVVEALGQIGDPVAVPALIACLQDVNRPRLSNDRICDLAARALIAINTPEARQQVQKWRKKSLNEDAEKHHGSHTDVATEFADIEEESDRHSILTQLLESLRTGNWQQRKQTAKSLREYAITFQEEPDPFAMRSLYPLLEHADWEIRWAVVEALGFLGDASAVPYLTPLLAEDRWTLKVATIRSLVEIGSATALESIVGLLKDDHENVREAAVEAIAILGGNSALDLLVMATSDKADFVRLMAIQALATLKDVDTIPALIPALGDESDQVRWATVKALEETFDERIIQGLSDCLQDGYRPHWEEQSVGDLAERILQQIDTLEANLALEFRRNKKPTEA